jgi:hypothetical protein
MIHPASVAWLLLAITVVSGEARSQTATVADPVFAMDYSNPGLSPSHWTLTIHPDGSGHFQSERGAVPPTGQHDGGDGIEAPSVDRDIAVSPEYAKSVFQTAHRHGLFAVECESHMKVAFQGWKKLSYRGPDGEGSCAFNYAKEKDIQALGDSGVAVAATIIEGARIEMLMQHDRLGLDNETQFLVEAAKDGRVQQIGAIRGILERLANDPAILERARKRARVLLARAADGG